MVYEAMPEMRALSLAELEHVSGGMMDEGTSHGVQTHVPGRLGPDETELGTMAGAPFGGLFN